MLQTSKNTSVRYLTILNQLFADDSDGFWDDLNIFTPLIKVIFTLFLDQLFWLFCEVWGEKSLWNIDYPDTSFGVHTDRYPDTKHKNYQTDTLTKNAFFMRLKLANIPKICVFTPSYEQALRPGGKGHTVPHALSLLVVRAAFLLLSALPQWLIAVAPKANQSKTSISVCH